MKGYSCISRKVLQLLGVYVMATNDGLKCIKNILEVVRTSVRESLRLHFNIVIDISPLATDSSSLAKDKIDFL